MNRSYRYLSHILFLPLALGVVSPCFALDLEAGLWNHIPLGSNFAGVAYAYTEGDISLDPTLLLEDVEMKLDTVGAKYIHAFEVWDKSARVAAPSTKVSRTRYRAGLFIWAFLFVYGSFV